MPKGITPENIGASVDEVARLGRERLAELDKIITEGRASLDAHKAKNILDLVADSNLLERLIEESKINPAIESVVIQQRENIELFEKLTIEAHASAEEALAKLIAGRAEIEASLQTLYKERLEIFAKQDGDDDDASKPTLN